MSLFLIQKSRIIIDEFKWSSVDNQYLTLQLVSACIGQLLQIKSNSNAYKKWETYYKGFSHKTHTDSQTTVFSLSC